MLSYRHAFHAGNHADILKHTSLTLILDIFNKKEKPFIYLDTHAGSGRYSLNSAWAKKTQEAQTGIQQLWAQRQNLPALQSFFSAIQQYNASSKLANYPGSPALAECFLRSQDRMVLMELHPQDSRRLQQLFANHPQVRILAQDGFAGLLAELPPLIKRGLVLIDPAYEVKQDYQHVPQTLQQAYRRWAIGTYAVWYPLLANSPAPHHMVKQIAKHSYGNLLKVELEVSLPAQRGMYGSGLLIVNPPWQLDTELRAILPTLSQILGQAGAHPWRVEWLQGPT